MRGLDFLRRFFRLRESDKIQWGEAAMYAWSIQLEERSNIVGDADLHFANCTRLDVRDPANDESGRNGRREASKVGAFDAC